MKLPNMLRRGIEPIVAAIILVVAAIVGGILLYLWTTGMIQSTTGATAATKPVVAIWASGTTSYINVTLRLPYKVSPSDVNKSITEVDCYYAINGSLAVVVSSPKVTYINPNSGVSSIYTIGIPVSLNSGTAYYCRIDLGKLGVVITPVFTVT